MLPSGYPIINDTRTGGADKALSAEAGKDLQEQIDGFRLGEVQTYGKVPVLKNYTQVRIDPETGEIESVTSTYAGQFVNEFPIDLVNRDYIASYGFGGSQTGIYTFNYYDAEWNYLGGAYKNPGGESGTSLTMAKLVFPDSWQSDLDTYKAQAAFVRIIGYINLRPADLYETWTIPQSIVARGVTPNQIDIYATLIKAPMLTDGVNNSTEIQTEDVVSPWGVMWPDTYSINGQPTQMIAMLHGSNGYVCEGCLGYTSGGWLAARQAYLDAGFAVMDINGYGISTEADEKSKHWGCPLAIETLDKAWEFIKQNFNVCDKLLIHGTSMGGNLAQSYAKCFPGKVLAVGCFAPNLLPYSIRTYWTSTKGAAWGYADEEDAIADGYKNLTGYFPLSACVMEEEGLIKKFDWDDYSEDYTDVLPLNLIDSFPVQMRVWQGTGDTQVYPSNSQLLVSSLRRGNSPVTLRMCDGAGHDLASVAYVRNEAVDYFKRFVVQYP